MKKSLKRLSINLFAIILVISGLQFCVGEPKTVKANDEYEIVWQDEFEGTSLNRNYWNVEHNGDGGGNQELQFYRDSTENIQVSNGTLKIKGLQQSYSGKSYTSGRINTKDKAEFRYGIIEARIKLPSFLGAWPAFWTLGGNHSEVGWPRCGEIDIMEAINTENYTHGALHWYGEGKIDRSTNSASILPSGFDRTQWHTYSIEWTESAINWMVDGNVFFTQSITDGYAGEFRKEQFIILNMAIGGQWPGFSIDTSKFPVTMEVDYVRVLQKPSQKNIIKGTGVTDVSPIVIPNETENRNVIEYKGAWSLFYNTAVVSGTGSSVDSKGYTMNIDYLGSKGRLITASIRDIDYIPGNTYKYSMTLESSINKYVTIKAIGEDPEEDVFGSYTVFLSAGSKYNFSENITIDSEYDGRVDLIVEMGGRIGGEYLPTDTSLVVTASNATFTGVAEKLKEIPTQKPTTTIPATTAPTTENTNPTTAVPTTVAKKQVTTTSNKITNKPARVKIKKIKNIKGRKVKITWKRIKNATKYQVRAICGKKTIKKTTRKLSCTLKKLQKNKKYKISVRAYNSAGYGKWSKVKKIRIKK